MNHPFLFHKKISQSERALAYSYVIISVPQSSQPFPRAMLSENCSLLGTGNVRGQISEPNGGYCLIYNSAAIVILRP